MGREHMVGLDVVLHGELPVRLDVEAHRAGMAHGREVVVGETFGRRGEVFGERRRLAVGVDEDPVVPDLGPHRHQARCVLAGLHDVVAVAAVEMGPRAQGAVQAVGPGMVGAGQQLQTRTGLGDHHRAAMAADVVEDAHGALAVTQQEQGHARGLDRHGIARFGNLMGETRDEPGAGEQAFVFEFLPALRGVADIGQGAGLRDGAGHGVQRIGTEQVGDLGPTGTEGNTRSVHRGISRRRDGYINIWICAQGKFVLLN